MPKDVAARTEIYAIPSLTISDQQFLNGDANGKQVTVAGEFRIAQGSGKLPVVVLMHGSSGVGAGMDPWVRHFNAMGISTFVIDSYSGRGLTAVGPTRRCSAGSTSSSISTARWIPSANIRASNPDPHRADGDFPAADRPRSTPASIASTSYGTSPARSSPPTFRSIRIARPAMPPTPRSRRVRSGSTTARPTTITRSRAARPISLACRKPNVMSC